MHRSKTKASWPKNAIELLHLARLEDEMLKPRRELTIHADPAVTRF